VLKFIFVIIILAVALFWGYSWWQNNSSRLAEEEIKRYSRNMVENPDSLSVKVNGIKIINKNIASIDKVMITGDNIILKEGINLSSFSLNLNDIVFPIPIVSKLNSVKSGYFKSVITEKALTEYLRKKNINIGLWKISADTINADIKKNNLFQISLPVVIPIIAKTSIIKVDGKLKYEGDTINFEPLNVSVSDSKLSVNQSTQLFNAIKMINPIVKLNKIPFTIKPQLTSTDNDITIKGNITGLR
jgi:hypothetical protein